MNNVRYSRLGSQMHFYKPPTRQFGFYCPFEYGLDGTHQVCLVHEFFSRVKIKIERKKELTIQKSKICSPSVRITIHHKYEIP